MTLARKRRMEDLCDDMVETSRTGKRSKYSVDPNLNDGGGGPKSLLGREPVIFDAKEKSETERSPEGLKQKEKVYLAKDFTNV